MGDQTRSPVDGSAAEIMNYLSLAEAVRRDLRTSWIVNARTVYGGVMIVLLWMMSALACEPSTLVSGADRG